VSSSLNLNYFPCRLPDQQGRKGYVILKTPLKISRFKLLQHKHYGHTPLPPPAASLESGGPEEKRYVKLNF
jgi:hypothetical protein